MVRAETASGTFINFEYNQAGEMVRETNALGGFLTFAYSQTGALVEQKDQLGHVSRFDVNGPFSQPLAFVDANGNVSHNTYSSLGQLSSTTYADHTSEQYQFDVQDNVNARTDRAGRTRWNCPCSIAIQL